MSVTRRTLARTPTSRTTSGMQANPDGFALYDKLTGLPNRRLLLDRFALAASRANRHRQQLALLFFDLNNFKGITDVLGNEAGDTLLKQVATRLSSSIRTSDTACRFGADEFVVLMTKISGREHVVNVLKNVRTELAPPYRVGRFSIRITVRNGLSIYPDDARTFSDLLLLGERVLVGGDLGLQGLGGDSSNTNIWLHDAEKVTCLSL